MLGPLATASVHRATGPSNRSPRWRRAALRLAHSYVNAHPRTFQREIAGGGTIRGTTADIIGRHIYLFGVWEPSITAWLSSALSEGDTFVDVGAHIGYYTVMASTLVGDSGHVVAVEASPTTFQQLAANCERQGLANTRLICAAASDRAGRIQLYEGPPTNTGLTTTIPGVLTSKATTVDAAPLGTLLSDEEIGSMRMLKIDVEGAEWPVLAGLGKRLLDTRPEFELLVEVNSIDFSRSGMEPMDLIAYLGRFGFYPYRIPNRYDLDFYLEAVTARPRRLRGELSTRADLVFSRRDCDTL